MGETGEEARGERNGESRAVSRDRDVIPRLFVVVDVVDVVDVVFEVEWEGEIISGISVGNRGGGNTPAIVVAVLICI